MKLDLTRQCAVCARPFPWRVWTSHAIELPCPCEKRGDGDVPTPGDRLTANYCGPLPSRDP